MTDEEAECEAWEDWVSHRDTKTPRLAHEAGFYAGLDRARKQADLPADKNPFLKQCIAALELLVDISNPGTMQDAFRALKRLKDSGPPGTDSKSQRSEASSSGDASYLLPQTQSELDALQDGANSAIAEAMRREGFLTRADLARIARKAMQTQRAPGHGALSALAEAAEENDDE